MLIKSFTLKVGKFFSTKNFTSFAVQVKVIDSFGSITDKCLLHNHRVYIKKLIIKIVLKNLLRIDHCEGKQPPF